MLCWKKSGRFEMTCTCANNITFTFDWTTFQIKIARLLIIIRCSLSCSTGIKLILLPSVLCLSQELIFSPTALKSARLWGTPTAAGCPPSCPATVARVPITVAICTSRGWTRCRTQRYRRAWFRAMRAIGPMIDHSLRLAKTSHTTARSHATSYTHSYQAPERLTNPTICVSTRSKCTISDTSLPQIWSTAVI